VLHNLLAVTYLCHSIIILTRLELIFTSATKTEASCLRSVASCDAAPGA
jgi:hypothetical protein